MRIFFGIAHVVVVRRKGDEITVNGNPCQHPATVHDTTMIIAAGSERRNRFQVDLAGGQFVDGSGHTVRRIPFHVDLAQRWDVVSVLGSNGPDAIRFGTLGINLDSGAGSQVDVTTTRVERIFVRSGPGDDVVSADGGFGTGHDSILPGVDTLFGGLGQDLLVGSNPSRTSSHGHVLALNGKCNGMPCKGTEGVDTIHGGLGKDTIYGKGMDDNLYGDEGKDTIHGNAGTDFCSGGPNLNDTAYSCLHNDDIEHPHNEDML
jgi:Ca2+-binding RTX toxin-like protein